MPVTPPFEFDSGKWADVAVSCIIGVVKKAGGVEKYLEQLDDESKRKLVERLVGLGEKGVSELFDGADEKPSLEHGINYKCNSQKTVQFSFTMKLKVVLDGETHTLPFKVDEEEKKKWQCGKVAGMSSSEMIEQSCSCCSDLPATPGAKR